MTSSYTCRCFRELISPSFNCVCARCYRESSGKGRLILKQRDLYYCDRQLEGPGGRLYLLETGKGFEKKVLSKLELK